MSFIKKIFLVVFLLYISLLPNRLGLLSQTANEIILFVFSIAGLFSFAIYLPKVRYRINRLDLIIIFILFIYPVFSSFTAWITAGQPLYMGLLTFRGLFLVLTYYTFLMMGFSQQTVLNYTTGVVSFVLIIVLVLFLVFNFNDFNTAFMKGSLVIKYGHTTTKGVQFSGFTCLFFIPYLYGWTRYFEKNKLSYLVFPALIFIFSIYVSKSRNEILTMAVLPLFMYYLKYGMYDFKYLFITGLVICALFIIILTDNVISRNFSGLLRPGDLEMAHKTKDYSAWLRIEEIKAGWKWFLKYPVTGVGSLSYRFNEGYRGLISDIFFISDIGIIGILIKGGLIFLAVYISFYKALFRIFSAEDIYSVTGRYLILFLLIELIIGNDYIFNYTGIVVVILLIRQTEQRFIREL